MGFFKKKNKNKEKFADPLLEREFKGVIQHSNTREEKEFREIEDMQYVRIQCEQISESSKYLEELKEESAIVQSYILDIQKIETMPDSSRNDLKNISLKISEYDKKRQALHDRPQTLPHQKMNIFERYEDDFPKALTNMQNDEKYATAVKHDLRLLEAEKISLKEDMKSYSDRHISLKNAAVIFLFIIIVAFSVFFFSGILNSQSGRTLFMVVMLLAVFIISMIFLLQRRSTYQFRLSEKKLVRTISLLNKTKIKYVNIRNSIDYQHEKFGVKNSYQLGREYDAYLSDKKNMERYHDSVMELDGAMLEMTKILDGLKLYDADIWEKQYSAFYDKREMDDILKKLISRQKKLKSRIDYNIERMENSKEQVLNFLRKHPERSKEIMELVDSYDVGM